MNSCVLKTHRKYDIFTLYIIYSIPTHMTYLSIQFNIFSYNKFTSTLTMSKDVENYITVSSIQIYSFKETNIF